MSVIAAKICLFPPFRHILARIGRPIGHTGHGRDGGIEARPGVILAAIEKVFAGRWRKRAIEIFGVFSYYKQIRFNRFSEPARPTMTTTRLRTHVFIEQRNALCRNAADSPSPRQATSYLRHAKSLRPLLPSLCRRLSVGRTQTTNVSKQIML